MPVASAVRGHGHVHVSVMDTAHTCRCWSGWSRSRLDISRRCDIGRRPVSGRARRLVDTGYCRIAVSAPGHRRLTSGWDTVLRHSQRRSTCEERGDYRETFQGDHGHPPKRIRLHSPVALDSDAKPPVHDGLVCSDVIADGTMRPDRGDDLDRPIEKNGSICSSVPVSASRHTSMTISRRRQLQRAPIISRPGRLPPA